MKALQYCVALAIATVSALALAQATAAPKPSATEGPRRLSTSTVRWTGDFDGMIERRAIRFLVPYSRSLYYIDKGRERGMAAELARDFERYVNQKHAKQLGKRPVTVFLIVTTRDRMFPELEGGMGDVAAGNLTATDERRRIADFVAPEDRSAVSEILVTGPSSPAIGGPDDLSGKTVHVRKSSSYYESLVALNERLRAQSRPGVQIVLVPDALEDEDLLEMLGAGLVPLAVVDDWKAKLWALAIPQIKARPDVVLRSGGHTGWAIRKGSPKLAAEIEAFYRDFAKKQNVIEVRLASTMKRAKQLRNPAAASDYERFQSTVALFRKYGQQYRFDPLMLAAQGFQESGLDQNVKSPVGAVGIMQVMPATGAELGVGDIHQVEPNINAGAKYLDRLMSKAFPDANFDEADRTLFAFASYNCGSGNVSKARKEAARRGLDPDKWFNNVEMVVAEKVGMETTTYVRNIYKYYVAYRLTADAREAAAKAREQVPPARR